MVSLALQGVHLVNWEHVPCVQKLRLDILRIYPEAEFVHEKVVVHLDISVFVRGVPGQLLLGVLLPAHKVTLLAQHSVQAHVPARPIRRRERQGSSSLDVPEAPLVGTSRLDRLHKGFILFLQVLEEQHALDTFPLGGECVRHAPEIVRGLD